MTESLAIEGGMPVRGSMLPYGRQQVDDSDIEAVVKVMRGDWLTTGPMVDEFENAFAKKVGAEHAVVVNSGTAALHAAMFAIDIRPGDEVIVPALTFAATANCVVYQGGTPVFVDIEPNTLLIDPMKLEYLITSRTRAIIAVDYAGQPCNYNELQAIADKHGLVLVSDACHAIGGFYRDRPVGALAELNTFSFHPVKHITTAEGGMITTNNQSIAEKMRWFRNHGISSDHRQRAKIGAWQYEMVSLGYNYRLSDINCALGLSQLRKLDHWLVRRQEIAALYNSALSTIDTVETLFIRSDVQPAWHIYPILLNMTRLRVDRAQFFTAMRAENIGVNVHYIPVYWHPYYSQLGYERGICPIAENAYERLITLPIFPSMKAYDVESTIEAITKLINYYSAD